MAPADGVSFDCLKVLLVEDNFQALNLAKEMLTAMGVTQIYTARNGTEALEFMGAFDDDDMINVVLCDWKMPGMSGLDLLQQIRTADPDIPFLMITGTADLQSVSEAKAAGVTAYIRKPYSADELRSKLSVIARIVEHRKTIEIAD